MKVEVGLIGEERFRREYGCEFLVYDETLINSIKLSYNRRNRSHTQPKDKYVGMVQSKETTLMLLH